MKAYIQKLKKRIDLNLLREDCRKLGINLLTVGFIGGLVSHLSEISLAKLFFYFSLGMFGVGLLAYGLLQRGQSDVR